MSVIQKMSNKTFSKNRMTSSRYWEHQNYYSLVEVNRDLKTKLEYQIAELLPYIEQVSPLPSGSHGILGDAFVRIFTNAGHKVTFISSMTKLTSSSNATVINVASNIKTFPDDLLNIKAIMDHKSDMRDDNLFFPVMDNLTLVTMQMKEVQELLNDETQSFDVVIAEWMYNEVYAGPFLPDFKEVAIYSGD
ncbi:hypothetical protein RR48_08712 [Papilio machaon]|uniref:Ecdysteroid UDP-glucosyltransferase n=1 Tax=Papilio machaon TaxID=76193 RepID=A0A194R7T6_PAPMA|nr:hypothetical protein RR48_08712 [Papilio machaon]